MDNDLVNLIETLISVVEEKDEYIKGHAERVATTCVHFSKKLGFLLPFAKLGGFFSSRLSLKKEIFLFMKNSILTTTIKVIPTIAAILSSSGSVTKSIKSFVKNLESPEGAYLYSLGRALGSR